MALEQATDADAASLHRSRAWRFTAAHGNRARIISTLALVASCAYEAGTAWGTGVGFMYQSVVEDYFTGYQRFFSRGWTSAYCYPELRPAFLGSMPTNLNDVLVQNKRWMSGMLAVGVSRRHSPLACRPLLRASLLQAMGYAYFGFAALYAVPVLCYATLPQLCFLRGVPLFPCPAAAAAAFASSLLQHLAEVCVAKRSLALRTWWNEQRFWVLNALTGQLFGCVSAAQELLGARALDFDLTSKATDGRLYQDGVFDFTGCSTLLLPATNRSPCSTPRPSSPATGYNNHTERSRQLDIIIAAANGVLRVGLAALKQLSAWIWSCCVSGVTERRKAT